MKFRGSHLLSAADFSLDDLDLLCETAERMQPYARRQRTTDILRGAVLANLFLEPSTRTRISFGAAFNRLGGSVRDTCGAETTSLVKGESLYDTSRVISGYADVIVLRHPDTGATSRFAEATHIPVINAGDGVGEHPTQALLDYYTLRRELPRTIDGMTIALLGDLKYGRTVHSLVRLLSVHRGITFVLGATGPLKLPHELHEFLLERGHRVEVPERCIDRLAECDVVYTTRLQSERFNSEAEAGRIERLTLDLSTLPTSNPRPFMIMHPLPRDSRAGMLDLSVELNGDKRLAVFRQTDYGVPVRMALFALILDVAHLIDTRSAQVTWYVPTQFGTLDP